MERRENRKGFTLVEILAVIVILAILIAVAVPSVLTLSSKMKGNMYCSKIETVEKAAQVYGQENSDTLYNKVSSVCSVVESDKSVTTVKQCLTVQVSELLAKGYLNKEENYNTKVKDEFYDPRDSTSMKTDKVYVYVQNKRIYAKFIYKTKDDAKACDGSYYIDKTNSNKISRYS